MKGNKGSIKRIDLLKRKSNKPVIEQITLCSDASV